MYKLIFLAALALLSGCTIYSSKPIADKDISLLRNAIVYSTLGDELGCSFVGFTIFNNKNTTYEINPELNQEFSSGIASDLKAKGIDAYSAPSDKLTYIDPKKGASNWRNITFKGAPNDNGSISSIVILDGLFQYNSTGGYYAKYNALSTTATLYAYEFPSGRLIGKSFSENSKLKRRFSCTQESMPDDDHMHTLLKSSGTELYQELIDTLFQ